MNIVKRFKKKLARFFWKNKLGSVGVNWNNGNDLIINNPHCVFLGNNVGIGSNTFFGPVTEYAGKQYSPKIIIGDGTWIGKHCSLASINKIEIGKHVLFAGYVHITDHSHGYEETYQGPYLHSH